MHDDKIKSSRSGGLPVGHNEDVEFSAELADHEDIEAQERARAADERAEKISRSEINQRPSQEVGGND